MKGKGGSWKVEVCGKVTLNQSLSLRLSSPFCSGLLQIGIIALCFGCFIQWGPKVRHLVSFLLNRESSHIQGCKKSSTFLTPEIYDSNLPTFSGNINPYFGSETCIAWLGYTTHNAGCRAHNTGCATHNTVCATHNTVCATHNTSCATHNVKMEIRLTQFNCYCNCLLEASWSTSLG